MEMYEDVNLEVSDKVTITTEKVTMLKDVALEKLMDAFENQVVFRILWEERRDNIV